ncbi:CoA transferase [Azospirillum sp.]|uniref:CaiB/BaiF CoA transferase family protein n=1 Tax=Azospirillum sp. TaxID=34012 RepID=UPI002D38DF1D|nr:CoA transferase [Azospirillum sp.]HYD69148.1 CoA transferase [Azospirillum sp.]
MTAQLLPLSHLKVLDLAWVVAGPIVGRVLADYGATVVRVESSRRVETARVMGPFPGGVTDPQKSGLYENCNAGKLGLTLDLSSAEGQGVIRDLAAWSGVVIESFSPGQMKRWGLDYESLKCIRPDLIMLSTSLMGQTGPYSSFAGFGNIGAAMSGFQNLLGWPGELPVGPFGPYTDYVAPRFSVMALLAALDHRDRTGEGCWIDVAQAEAGIQFLAPEIVEYAATGHIVGPNGNRDPDMAPHGVFPCKGGEDAWVAVAVRDDAEWDRLARLVGGDALARDARFATLAGRKANEDVLEALVSAWTVVRTPHAVEATLQELGIPSHVAASSADFVDDPHLQARGHLLRLPHPLMGESVVEASRFTLSDTPGRPARSAPTFGRDEQHVLAGLLGYGEERIAALREAGVLV